MIKDKINVREEGLNSNRLLRSISHNFRVRNDLDNVDYSKTKDNYLSSDLESTRKEIERLKKEHKGLYLKEFGENLREARINSFKEIVISFPSHFRQEYDNKKITKEQLNDCVNIFIQEYEKATGLKVLNYSLHTDELTPHYHLISTNFINNGRTFKKKGYKSWLQDLGGFSFESMGLKRGIKKQFTKAEHKTSSQHYEEILRQGEKLEEYLSDESITLENIDSVISQAIPPFKTLLTYIKRSMNIEKEAGYILKQQERALNQFYAQFPKLKHIKNFEEMLKHIEINKDKFKTNKLAPK